MENEASRFLLSARQMAEFAVNGFLQIEGLVPQELNEAVLKEEISFPGAGYSFWNQSKAIREVFELPQVRGALISLVGQEPVYDHSFLHVVKPKHLIGQEWHGDSVVDTRTHAFDIQAFYFAHDAPAEMGPTLVLPGSHLRSISTASIGHYRNIVGQRKLVSKAGTIAFMHHGIWHCAQPNFTDTTRYVFKLRLRPGQQQRALFNTEGYRSPEVQDLFKKAYHPWCGNEARLNQIAASRFWRYLCGDDRVDVSFEGVLTRMGIRE